MSDSARGGGGSELSARATWRSWRSFCEGRNPTTFTDGERPPGKRSYTATGMPAVPAVRAGTLTPQRARARATACVETLRGGCAIYSSPGLLGVLAARAPAPIVIGDADFDLAVAAADTLVVGLHQRT